MACLIEFDFEYNNIRLELVASLIEFYHFIIY